RGPSSISGNSRETGTEGETTGAKGNAAQGPARTDVLAFGAGIGFILLAWGALALLSAGLASPREPGAGAKPRPLEVRPGMGKLHLRLGDHKLEVFTYRPKNFGPKHGPMILIFHGQARDAEHYRDAAVKLARQCKGIVVAPLF